MPELASWKRARYDCSYASHVCNASKPGSQESPWFQPRECQYIQTKNKLPNARSPYASKCVHAIIAGMMIFDDPYYSFDMFQRRLRDISKQDQRKASEWFSGRYGARLTGIPVSALWNDSYVRTMNALHILRNEYPRKAIDAVAMDYLNGTFPAFVSPRMSETLIGLHASIDGGKALEPLADAVGYVNGHAVPNPATTDGYGQTITAAELMMSMIGKTETKAFWRDDDNDGSAGKAVMADAMNIIRDACDAFLTLMDTGIIGCTDIIHTLGACKEYGSDWRDRMGMLVDACDGDYDIHDGIGKLRRRFHASYQGVMSPSWFMRRVFDGKPDADEIMAALHAISINAENNCLIDRGHAGKLLTANALFDATQALDDGYPVEYAIEYAKANNPRMRQLLEEDLPTGQSRY